MTECLLRFPANVLKELDAWARSKGKSRAELIRMIVWGALQRHRESQ